MPTRKTESRLERLDHLESRLQSDDAMTVEGIAREFGVSRRTLCRDIAILRDRGLPIEADKGRGGGVRIARSWGVGRINLTYREAVELVVSLAIAEQMDAPWLIANLAPIRRKLAASFSPEMRQRIGALSSRIMVGQSASPAVLGTFSRPDSASTEALCRAFIELRQLRFGYTDGSGVATIRHGEPHYLMLNYPVWYLVCWDLDRAAIRSFRLDRMHSADISEVAFTPRRAEDFAEAFAGISLVPSRMDAAP
ncbi:MAG: WYL domain-containing protein [Pseudomonadota bacterium]